MRRLIPPLCPAESQKLPEKLQEWLFPADGTTRHLPSLQVSFGSNDDFFASDTFGKISSRDSNSPGEPKSVPKLAEVARGFMRKKAHTISSPTSTETGESTLRSPILERRNTFMGSQLNHDSDSKLKRISTREPSLSRPDLRPEISSPEHRRKRSILIGAPPIRPTWPDRKVILSAKERLKLQEDRPCALKYVDSGMQTDPNDDCLLEYSKPEIIYPRFPSRPQIPMGSMQDFFRCQYRLGDALQYV